MKKQGRVLSFRTKAEVILLVGLLICMSVVSVMSVTRTITDSSDNVETFIKNSNGNYWAATGSNIQLAIDDLGGAVGTVWCPNVTISSHITLRSNLRLVFNGWMTLDDGGVETDYMLALDAVNVTIINPMLNGDRDNNEVNPANGMQMCISMGNSAENVHIIGGKIKNTRQSAIGGYGNNISIDGTVVENTGEHGIYFSSGSNQLNFNNMRIFDIGSVTRRGYGIKLDNCHNVSANMVTIEYIDGTNWVGDNPIGYALGNGCSNIDVQAYVKNANYAIVAKGTSPPNRNIKCSFNCINVSMLMLTDAKASDGIYVYDSSMDSGGFYLSYLGDGGILDNFKGYNSFYAYDDSSRNISYTVQNSHFTNTGQSRSYLIDVRTGYDLKFINCVFRNGEGLSNLRLEGIVGTITIRDCIFKGGTNYNIRFDSTPAYLIVEGCRFKELYNDIDAPLAISFVKEPVDKYLHFNINLSNVDTLETCIWNSNGKYYESTRANLKLAIDDLTSGGTVWINSDLTIDVTIQESNDISIIGASERHVTLTAHDDLDDEIFDFSNGNNITIKNIKFDMNGAENTGKAFKLANTKDILIENCIFTDSYESAIYAITIDKIKIINCDFYGIGGAASKYCIVFEFGTSPKSVNNVTISNCNMYNTRGGFKCQYGNDIIISNNFIMDTTGYGLYLTSTDNTTISTNVIESTDKSIYLASTCDTIASNNILKGSYGIYENGADYSVYVGNNARHCATAGYYIRATHHNATGNMGTHI